MIDLLSDGFSISVNPPQYPYTVTINMCMRMIETVYGRIHWLDQGIDYDSRSTEIKWLLSAVQTLHLQNLMTDEAREKDIRITCPANSGLHVFGPDLGDTGYFWAKLNTIETSGMKYKPYRYFETTTLFNLLSYPVYQIPSAVSEGLFELGDVTGVLQMQREIGNNLETGVNRNESLSGKITSIDLSPAADIYDADIQILAGTHKMAEIIHHLQVDIRGNPFTINNPCNTYLFGAQKVASDEYMVILRDSKLVCTCTNVNKWVLDLKLRLVV